MSRARPIQIHDQKIWFDRKRNHVKATADQLEYLAAAEDIDIDDLLDESLIQAEVMDRLRAALGVNKVPKEVEERRELKRKERQELPECRICAGIGNSTRHHFVNRWMMKELSNYDIYSHRSKCTIPVCVECHRDLHSRDYSDKSIIPYLNDHEKMVASSILEDLSRERPRIFLLLVKGNYNVYETRLIYDYLNEEFDVQT